MKVQLALRFVAICHLASATEHSPPGKDHADASALSPRQLNFGHPPEVSTQTVLTTMTVIGSGCPDGKFRCGTQDMIPTTKFITDAVIYLITAAPVPTAVNAPGTNVNTPAPAGSSPPAASRQSSVRFTREGQLIPVKTEGGRTYWEYVFSTAAVNSPAPSVPQTPVNDQSTSPPATSPKSGTLPNNSAPQPASASIGSINSSNIAPSSVVGSGSSLRPTTPVSTGLALSTSMQIRSSSLGSTILPPPSSGAPPSLSSPAQTSSTVPVPIIASAGTSVTPLPSQSSLSPPPPGTSSDNDNPVPPVIVGPAIVPPGGVPPAPIPTGGVELPGPEEPSPTDKPTTTNKSSTTDKTSTTSKSSTTSCTEKVAETTYVTCTGTVTSKDCRPYTTSTFTSCNATSGVTTRFCSSSQVTQTTVFCAQTGSDKSCISTNSVATQVISGCDLTATQTTTYAPACPAQMTLGPELSELDNNGGLEDGPRTFGSADPNCEDPGLVDYTVPYDSVLRPAIEDFCRNPGEGALSSFGDGGPGFRAWERLCSFGKGYTVLQFQVASNEGKPCETEMLKQADCIKQLSAIANKCVSKDNKNDRIDGEVWNQKCHGYMLNVMTWVEGNKPPPCKTFSYTSSISKPLPSPTGDTNAPDGWQFQVVAQWRRIDYDRNVKDGLEFGLYGARAGIDMTSCAYYAPDDNDGPAKSYGDGVHHYELAVPNGISGNVKDLVDKPGSKKMLPFDIAKGPNNVNNGLAGAGVWPRGVPISLDGPCAKNCAVKRHLERTDELHVMCDRPLGDCKPIKDQGLSTLVDRLRISYRCREVPKNVTSCSFPGDLQKDRSSVVDTFMQLLVCDSTGKGSGLVNINPPKPAKDRFKDINFALVYHWTEDNFHSDRGTGDLQLYSYKRNGSELNCNFFNKKPGDAFGYIEQPLDTIPGMWVKGTLWKAWMQRNDLKPRLKPDYFPNSISTDEAKQLAWPQNDCVKRCVLQKKGGKDEWWVRCNMESDKCMDRAPADKPYFDIKCRDVWPIGRLNCGSDSKNAFYPIMECAGDEDAGWFKMIEENKANPPKDVPVKNANNADTWEFQLGLQWSKSDYYANAENRLEWGFYGGEAAADMSSCDFYYARQPDAKMPGYGHGAGYVSYAHGEGGVTGRVRNAVDDPLVHSTAIPISIARTGTDHNGGVSGSGVYPADNYPIDGKIFLDLDSACAKGCHLVRERKAPDELYVRCVNLSKDCNLIEDRGLGGSTSAFVLDYQCERITSPKKTSCIGIQKESGVLANTFMPLFRCDAKGAGSGLKNKVDPIPANAPASKKDSFRDLDFMVAYHYTESNYKANKGSGTGIMYAFERANTKPLDCSFFDQKPGDAYGMAEVELLTTGAWVGDMTLQRLVDRAGGIPFPRFDLPVLGSGTWFLWKENGCAKECRADSVSRHHWDLGNMFYRVICRNEDEAKCADPHPVNRPTAVFEYGCRRFTPSKYKCGSDFQNYFIPIWICTGYTAPGWDFVTDRVPPK